MRRIFHPAVTVIDNGDGTAEIEFDWENSIHPNDIEGDNLDDNRLADALDQWKGRPESFTIVIPKDTRVVQKKDAAPK